MTENNNAVANRCDHSVHIASVVEEIASRGQAGSLFEWNPDANGAISKMFNCAFKSGGLDEVDGLIEEINTLLLQKGATFVFTPGAACQMDADGKPDSLMVYYQKSGGHNPICNQWITLERN